MAHENFLKDLFSYFRERQRAIMSRRGSGRERTPRLPPAELRSDGSFISPAGGQELSRKPPAR